MNPELLDKAAPPPGPAPQARGKAAATPGGQGRAVRGPERPGKEATQAWRGPPRALRGREGAAVQQATAAARGAEEAAPEEAQGAAGAASAWKGLRTGCARW